MVAIEISRITKCLILCLYLAYPFKNKHVKAKFSIEMLLYFYNSGIMCFEFNVTDKTKCGVLLLKRKIRKTM